MMRSKAPFSLASSGGTRISPMTSAIGHAGQGARDHLPFAADVDHAAAESDRDADADEENRRRLDQRLRHRILGAGRALQHKVVGFQRVRIQREQQYRGDQQRQKQGDDDRRKVNQPVETPCQSGL